ncbi:hypothetical protein [Burkholderia cepacia]|uniref:hypothetical protein n=1 Tax=Burkholderia cepacia TaxID=292 RepID=UPI002AB7989F|nr:hypothetical protein [Burkholderia cepacia]
MTKAPSAISNALSTEAFREQIVAQFTQFATGITTEVPAPDGHYWQVDVQDETTWFLGCPIKSTCSGASIDIRRQFAPGTPQEMRDRTARCSTEVRFFWPAQTVKDGRGKEHVFRPHEQRFKAVIFAKWGGVYIGCGQPLLEGAAMYCYASTVEELIEATSVALRTAFSKLPTPPRGLHLTESVISRLVETGVAVDRTQYAQSLGYAGARRVVVLDGRVVTHRWKDWFDFCGDLRAAACRG